MGKDIIGMVTFEKAKVGNLLEKISKQQKVPKNQYLSFGKYPIVDQGDGLIGGYTNDENLLYQGNLPIIIFGDHTRRIKLVKEKFCLGADGTQVLYTTKINQIYFYYTLRAINLKNYGYQRHFKYLKDCDIYFPKNIEDQLKIISSLSVYDELIETNEKNIKILEEMARCLYIAWFVNFKFPGHEKAAMVNMKLGDKVIPKNWEVKMINDLLAKVKGKQKIKTGDYRELGAFPIIDQGKGFVAGYIDDRKYVYDEDLIVFGDHTRCFKYCNFPFACGADGTQLLKTNDSNRMPQILLYFAALNAGLQNYNYARHFKFLKSLMILLPDVETAQKFESKVKPLYEQIKKLQLINFESRRICDLLIPQLVTGKRELK